MKFSRIGLVIFVLLCSCYQSTAQFRRTDFMYRTNILFQVFGPEFMGIHANMYLTNQVSVNTGIGANLDAHIGGNYYFKDRSLDQGVFYAGGQLTTYRQVRLDDIKPARQIGFYIPIGYEYILKNRVTLAADIGYNYAGKRWSQANTHAFLGSFKIGITTRSRR